MQSIHELIPEATDLLELEPEELAGFVLEFLNNAHKKDEPVNLQLYARKEAVHEYPAEHQGAISMALMEAWAWLEGEGLLVQAPWVKESRDWFFISRRGRQMRKAADFNDYLRNRQLPRYLLQPVINQKVWPVYLRGDYESAVTLAFKEVEIAVRDAAGFGVGSLPRELMFNAFKENGGPLSDPSLPTSEQEGLKFLFAGATGWFRNPFAHRRMAVADPTEAAEMIVLASHLLRIVDARRPTGSGNL